MTDARTDITRILKASGSGGEAVEQLLPLLYDELRKTASALLRSERPGVLATTELVHEAYLRLFDAEAVPWNNRKHFFGAAATAMRRILVDRARASRAQKRIPQEELVPLDRVVEQVGESGIDLLGLDQALERLAEIDPRRVRIVELRYFVGLSEAEVAEVLDVSPRTVAREWHNARRWLFTQMS